MKKQGTIAKLGLASLLAGASAGCGEMILGMAMVESANIQANAYRDVHQASYPNNLATINKVWIEPNVKDDNGNLGMNIRTNFRVWNKRGNKIGLVTHIYDNNGNPLMDRDGVLTASTGQVGVAGRILSPNFNDTVFNEFMFLPYNQLDPTSVGKNYYQARVTLFDRPDGNWGNALAISGTEKFWVTFK